METSNSIKRASESTPTKTKNSGEIDSSSKKKRTDNDLSTQQPAFLEELIDTSNQSIDEKCWARADPPPIDPQLDSIVFQQLEIDEHDHSDNETPVLRMFGLTEFGNSVLCLVHGFLPYFYFPAPIELKDRDLSQLVEIVKEHCKEQVVNASIVNKESIMGFHDNTKMRFVKIEIGNPRKISSVRKLIEQGVSFGNVRDYASETYESNLEYTLRFMIDTEILGGNWVELPAGSYRIRSDGKVSRCQIEVETKYDSIISHAPEGGWAKIAPLRTLSFDIECAGRKGIFPEAKIDSVIQIANIIQIQGQSKPIIKNVFCLRSCAPIAGVQIICFENERDLLQKWSDFIKESDPDLLIGYNIANFDLPYLMDRASALGVDRFPFLGRISDCQTKVKDTFFSSKAYGSRENKLVNMEGRIQLDILQVMLRDYKLRSYSLNSVCNHFLGETKEDVHYSTITDLFEGDENKRRRLAVYCLKDAYLPLRLMDKLMCFINYLEMARVTGIPFNYLLSRGQQIKVVSQLYRKSHEQDLVIPSNRYQGDNEAYEGATVIEPEKGFYNVPIATLDFASLYPSIMMAHNLCYTTLIDAKTINKYNLTASDYIVTPTNDMFITAAKRKGLLPTILEDLLSARKRAKAELKNETDPFRKAVLDGRQLALKISANSVYGFTGATVGKLPCLQISSSVTAYGRQMIEKTKQLVESNFPTSRVIYGDTDSVMVDFKIESLEETMEMGRKAAKLITQEFIAPIKLEFEKVYYPYLLINKKRYAGLYWTNPTKYDKLDTKGIETVRRDNCPLVPTVINSCLRKIFIERNLDGAQSFVKQVISDLLQNKIDLSQLVITKALSKSDYAGKQAHSELAERMRKRDAGSAPSLGDRVAYVIIKGAKGAAAYEKSEDPIYVLENNIPIDTKYYLENQLSKPLMRIFEPILKEKADSLVNGEHTRTIQVSAPTTGMMMKFAVKKVTCIKCKSILKDEKKAVCDHCKPHLAEVYHKQMKTFNEMEIRHSRLWTQCQRCQESLHEDVLCSSKDCPIFYMRKKAQKDANDAFNMLSRFNYDW